MFFIASLIEYARTMTYKWQATLGLFKDEANGSIRFVGGTERYNLVGTTDAGETTGPSVGNYISNQRFEGGEISATVEFEEPRDGSACQLLFYYEPLVGLRAPNFITAGLSSRGYLCSINSFFEGRWTLLAGTGTSGNLIEGRRKNYELRVKVAGSSVALEVDDVQVLRAVVPTPVPSQTQAGLWCTGHTDILIKDYKVETEEALAFVVMPFSPPYDDLNVEVIQRICKSFELDALRADDVHGPGIIVNDIAKQITKSRLVIAEVTEPNPNVYYEVGYAHALQKDTILIAAEGTKLPFDIAPFRTLFYANTIGGNRKVEAGLKRHLEAILERRPTEEAEGS